jgi:hypothetical protein
MARASGVAFLLILLAAGLPLVAAAPGVPTPIGDSDRIAHYYYRTATQTCDPADPVVSVATLSLLSEIRHELLPDGMTRYRLHLEAAVPREGCTPFDLEFTSALPAWLQGWNFAPIASPCGATGWVVTYGHAEGVSLQLYLTLPEGCVDGYVGSFEGGANVQPLHPSDYLVCPADPLVSACLGVVEGDTPYSPPCPSGRSVAYMYVTFVLYVHRHCFGPDGETVYVSSLVGPSLQAREGECILYVSDGVLGIVEERVDCAGEVGTLIYEADWGHMLP